MIETPTDAAATKAASAALERDLAAHAAVIDRVRELVSRASSEGSKLVLDQGTPGQPAWQGLASRAFASAAANLTRELAQIDDRLVAARRLIDAASFEVASGV